MRAQGRHLVDHHQQSGNRPIRAIVDTSRTHGSQSLFTIAELAAQRRRRTIDGGLVQIGEHAHRVRQSRQHVAGGAAFVIHREDVQHRWIDGCSHLGEPSQEQFALPRPGAPHHHRVRPVAHDVDPKLPAEIVVAQHHRERRRAVGARSFVVHGCLQQLGVGPATQRAHHGVGRRRIHPLNLVGGDDGRTLRGQFVSPLGDHDHAGIPPQSRVLHPTFGSVDDAHHVRRVRIGMGRSGQTDRSTHRTGPSGQAPVGRTRAHAQAHRHRPRRRRRRRSVNPDHRTGGEVDQPRHVIHYDGRLRRVDPHRLAPASDGHPPHVVVSSRTPVPQPFVTGGHQRGQLVRVRMFVTKAARARPMPPIPLPHVIGFQVGALPVAGLDLTTAPASSTRRIQSPHRHGQQCGHHRHHRERHVPGHQTEQSRGHDARQKSGQTTRDIRVAVDHRGCGQRCQRVGDAGFLPRSQWWAMERLRGHASVMPPNLHRPRHR